ncbi:blue light receptor [Pichia californica]|uniref:Blue light receptor n=1 Tax=Pichia californica TaxID=460514 RepID=A0A9P6WJA7_9ASCO|nr:blue light receptor [[Candida] californica]KAG0687972.1 blue light receptor [[Candida] californica]
MRPSVFTIIPQIIPLAFLIIASITAPTITKLYLAKDSNNTIYGIFGYCSLNSNSVLSCTSISINTDLSSILSTSLINSSIINKLIPFFILTPISAFLTFSSLLLNLLSLIFSNKFNSFNSKFYWILNLIISILAFLTSSFICIITFLIYYPYVQWLTWCLIPTSLINLITIISMSFSFNHLTTSIYDDDDDDEDNNNHEDNNHEDNNEKSLLFNNTTDFNHLPNDIPKIEKSSNLEFMSHSINSSTSSIFTRDNDKTGDLLITTKKVITQNSNSNSNTSLKVPIISDPYSNNNLDDSNISFSNYIDNENLNLNNDSRLSDNEINSANSSSSNFTSISQRPINPNYYAGANNNNNNSNNKNYQNQYQQQPFNQNISTQQYHQQRQYNHYQNQMSGMPLQNNNNNNYMRKPKPYMMMNQRQNFTNQQQQFPQQQFPQQQFQPNRQQPNRQFYNNNNLNNQQFHQLNPYAPKVTQPRANTFVPMKYRNRNNISNLAPSGLGNDGPYSGFR